MQEIKNTGDLRKFICEAIVSVRDGKLNLEAASRITKLAGQVNESFYAEIKTYTVMKEMGGVTQEIGQLPIDKLPAKQ